MKKLLQHPIFLYAVLGIFLWIVGATIYKAQQSPPQESSGILMQSEGVELP